EEKIDPKIAKNIEEMRRHIRENVIDSTIAENVIEIIRNTPAPRGFRMDNRDSRRHSIANKSFSLPMSIGEVRVMRIQRLPGEVIRLTVNTVIILEREEAGEKLQVVVSVDPENTIRFNNEIMHAGEHSISLEQISDYYVRRFFGLETLPLEEDLTSTQLAAIKIRELELVEQAI
ncbi:MAG: hypothetical protein ABH952_12480, partial [Candidatus Omnitrophota bacterium]